MKIGSIRIQLSREFFFIWIRRGEKLLCGIHRGKINAMWIRVEIGRIRIRLSRVFFISIRGEKKLLCEEFWIRAWIRPLENRIEAFYESDPDPQLWLAVGLPDPIEDVQKSNFMRIRTLNLTPTVKSNGTSKFVGSLYYSYALSAIM